MPCYIDEMIYVGLIFMLGFCASSVWLAIKSLRTGVVHRPWPEAARSSHPLWFWFSVAGLCAIALASLAFGLLLLFVIVGLTPPA